MVAKFKSQNQKRNTPRILLVEDSPGDVALIRELLSESWVGGIEIESVHLLSEALERIKAVDIDIVLLDLGLPDSRGLETLLKLQAVAPELPVIVLTGNVDQDAGISAVRGGAQDYLIKGQSSASAVIRSIRYGLERAQSAAALRESENKFRTIIDVSPVPYALNDDKQNIIFLNKAFVRLFGYTIEDIPTLAEWWPKAYPDPEYRQWVANGWQDRLEMSKQEGTDFKPMELAIRCKDNSVRTAMVGAVPLGESWEGTHLVILYDITDRKKSEEALHELSVFNHQVIQSAQEGIVVYGPDLKCQTWNYFMEQLSGLPAQEVVGRHYLDIFPFLQEAGILANLEKALTGETSGAERFKFHFPSSGRSGWVSSIAAPLKTINGEIVGVIETIRDITEHVQSEETIMDNALEWAASFNAMADGVSIHGVDHTILNANESLLRILGKSPDEVIGKKCFQIFHGKDCHIAECPLERTKETGQKTALEIFEPTINKLVHISTSPLFNEEGALVRIVHTVRDVTEQRRIEDQLRQSQKMEAIGTLAGGIAHDFNNILTAIIGFGEIVMDQLPLDSQLREDQAHVVAAGKRAKELVKQILAFSRRNEHELQPLIVQLVVKEALKLLRASIPTSIEIRQEIDGSCGLVMADPVQIHQVVMNLCTNAYQAMRETGGVMSVSLKGVVVSAEDVDLAASIHPGQYLCLEVADNGCGMSRAVCERIFEPYFTTKGTGEGTGLGLSMVHGIVTGLGGAVSVHSEPGEGTIFKIYLPLIAGETVHQTGALNEAPAVGNESIMLIDDEDAITRLESKLLEALGYRVTAFNRSEEALQAFRDSPEAFDLILTDMTMPGMNGSELAREIRSIRPAMPVIICTGFSDLIDAEKATDLGISEFLLKPVTKNELAGAVRRVLDGAT